MYRVISGPGNHRVRVLATIIACSKAQEVAGVP